MERASKRRRSGHTDERDASSGDASAPLTTLLLDGSAGIYTARVIFAGVSRLVMLDTGSPLSWVPKTVSDQRLRTDGAQDGDCYADGQRFAGEYRYGNLALTGQQSSIELEEAGMLLVTNQPQGVLGLSRRLAPPWIAQGSCAESDTDSSEEHDADTCPVPYPGDLITQILRCLPLPYISLHLDPAQAKARCWSHPGPSRMVFGGLHARSADNEGSESYVWADATLTESEWMVELLIGFTSNAGTTELQPVRALVDTGASHFKVNSALAASLSRHWGISLAPPDTDPATANLPVNCPHPGLRLEGLGVRFLVGDAELTVAASNLLFQEGDTVVCNRIAPSNRMSGATRSHWDANSDHDCVFGNAFLAGLEAVAFDYGRNRIGFLA